MTAEQKICGGPGCSEPLTSTHGNAIYHSSACRNRYSKMVRKGEIALDCPRCGHRTKSRHRPGCCGRRVCTPCRNHKCGKVTS